MFVSLQDGVQFYVYGPREIQATEADSKAVKDCIQTS